MNKDPIITPCPPRTDAVRPRVSLARLAADRAVTTDSPALRVIGAGPAGAGRRGPSFNSSI